MRSTASGLIGLALTTGCATHYTPEAAVLTGWDRTRAFADDAPSTVQYSGHALVPSPVIPVIPFGQAYDLAVVVATRSDIGEFEFARTSGPDGVRWLVVETDANTGERTLISNVEGIDAWAPELPVRRKVDPAFKVVDRSTNDEIEVVISYTNADNEEVEATLAGDPPFRVLKKRNADNLGAMRQSSLLVVDRPHLESLFKANVKVNGRGVKVAKAAGFVPLQFATEEVVGGLAVGQFTTVAGEVRPLEPDWEPPRVIAPEPEVEEEPAEVPPEEQPDPLRAQMEAGIEDLMACYTAAAEGNADLEGRVLLSWKVAGGAASDVTVVLDTVGDEGLASCIVEKLTGWTYDEAIEGDVGFPITVVKGEGIVLTADAEEASGEASGEGEGDDASTTRTVTGARGGGTDSEDEGEADEGSATRTVSGARGGADQEGQDEGAEAEGGEDEGAEAEGGDAEGAEGGDLPDGDDLLADDPEEEQAKPAVVYNGVADFTSRHVMRSGNQVELDWKVDNAGDRVYVRQVAPERTLQFEYLVNYDSLELTDVSVFQAGRPVPAMHMDINPAIPDLRRPFSGRAESRYVIDVNGQEGYATGKIEAWWSEGGPKVKVIPDAPDWTTDGELVTTIVFRQGGSDIAVRKTGGE